MMADVLEGIGTEEDLRVETDLRLGTPWSTVVWDDPVNLMTYVSWVFRSYFGYPKDRAERLMLQVHTEGSAVVATGSRELMERHVEAMHTFGLLATLRPSEP
jgi:ATP-dependent Clp protease adaptor protein ClpS